MGWIKNVIIDIAVAALIVIAAVFDQKWAWWIIVVYTPLMLLLKLVVWVSPAIANLNPRREETPRFVLHVLYAVSFAFCIVGGWPWLAAGWALIWLLSASLDMRQAPAGQKARK